MSACRGILIAGVSNRARTQMAEGFLRALSCGAVYIKSGGVHHNAGVHPLAVSVMQEVGIDISGQSVSSLESARRQSATYDVYISVDASYHNRQADRYHALSPAASDSAQDNKNHELRAHSMLFPATPAHWQVGFDAADARQRWELWSPRDPSIAHERSTRRFQDDLYEGEPLFMRLELNPMRKQAKVSERWEVEEVATAFAMESADAQRERFRTARTAIAAHSVRLLRRLEKRYGERLITNDALTEQLSTTNAVLHEAVHTTALDGPAPFPRTLG